MFSKKITTKSVIALSDESISYLSLERNEKGIFISAFEKAPLETGIIKKGEVLQADLLEKIFKKIGLSLKNKDISLILPFDYFSFRIIPDYTPKKNQLPHEWFGQYKKKHHTEESWLSEYEYTFFEPGKEENQGLFIAGITVEMFNTYQHIIKKSGLRLAECTADVLAFLPEASHERDILCIFSEDMLRLVECKNGFIHHARKFESSYEQYISDIQKVLGVSGEQAQKIFQEYGLLRAHKDEAVYRKLHKSTGPVLQYLAHKKNLLETHISLFFFNTPIHGVDDIFASFVGSNVSTFYPISQKKGFHEVLTLHKKESYGYLPHITQALGFFKK